MIKHVPWYPHIPYLRYPNETAPPIFHHFLSFSIEIKTLFSQDQNMLHVKDPTNRDVSFWWSGYCILIKMIKVAIWFVDSENFAISLGSLWLNHKKNGWVNLHFWWLTIHFWLGHKFDWVNHNCYWSENHCCWLNHHANHSRIIICYKVRPPSDVNVDIDS